MATLVYTIAWTFSIQIIRIYQYNDGWNNTSYSADGINFVILYSMGHDGRDDVSDLKATLNRVTIVDLRTFLSVPLGGYLYLLKVA